MVSYELNVSELKSKILKSKNETNKDNFSKEELSFLNFMKDSCPQAENYSIEELNYFLKNLSPLTDKVVNSNKQFFDFLRQLKTIKCRCSGGREWW